VELTIAITHSVVSQGGEKKWRVLRMGDDLHRPEEMPPTVASDGAEQPLAPRDQHADHHNRHQEEDETKQ
jgi:hypothetical protein